MAVSGAKLPIDTMLLSMIFDAVNWLKWAQTKDAAKNRNRPKSLYDALTKQGTKEKIETYTSAEDFERQRTALLGIEDGE